MEYPEELECEGISDRYDLYNLTPHVQNSMALVAPAAECPGKLAMYDQLIAVYFDKFHHHWPILHEEIIRSRRVPQVLLKTVVTIGLYLTGNAELKKMAKDTLERFLHHSGNTLVSTKQMVARSHVDQAISANRRVPCSRTLAVRLFQYSDQLTGFICHPRRGGTAFS